MKRRPLRFRDAMSAQPTTRYQGAPHGRSHERDRAMLPLRAQAPTWVAPAVEARV